MKKFVTIVVSLLIMITLISNTKVYAHEVEFSNFDFESTKVRENGKIKVKISLEWETETKIAISSIITEINGQIQSDSKIESIVDEKIEKNVDGTEKTIYCYSLSYIVEHWQIGTMTLKIGYFNIEDGDSYVKEFCIPGGKWLNEEVSWPIAFLFGIFVTACVGVGTYIIIENSKKGYLDSESDE